MGPELIIMYIVIITISIVAIIFLVNVIKFLKAGTTAFNKYVENDKLK